MLSDEMLEVISEFSSRSEEKVNKTRVESDQPDKRFLVEKFFWSKIF